MATSLPPLALWNDVPDSVWRAPLVPVALTTTAGVVLDKTYSIPLSFSLILAVGGLLAWVVVGRGRQRWLGLVYLWAAFGGLGAAYHHWCRNIVPANDLFHVVGEDPVPAVLRGHVAGDPVIRQARAKPILRTFPEADSTRFVLQATRLRQAPGWLPAAGKVQVWAPGRITSIRIGDEVEVVGRLSRPPSPANPGERDWEAALLDEGVRTTLAAEDAPGAVTRLSPGGWSLGRFLANCRRTGEELLRRSLPRQQAGLAAALLLGDGSALATEDWERYQRSGVIHVLVISGQHFLILAGFLWYLLRLSGIRRRRGTLLVAGLLLAYALLVGWRPPVARAAVMALAYCGTILLHRPLSMANTYALAWLCILAWNPSDVFDPGCQLSFLAIAVLVWGPFPPWRSREDPLEQLRDESRPAWLQFLRRGIARLLWAYAASGVVSLALAPLLAADFDLFVPGALLIGPPVVFLSSIALIAGLAFFVSAALCWPLAQFAAWQMGIALTACDWLVDLALDVPGSYAYVPGVPRWWVKTFYLGLLACLTWEVLRRHWRWTFMSGLGWICLGLVIAVVRPSSGELRCTFLAVGHGGCTVLETPDGRKLLYDAGAISGPDVTRRHIAPFLWERGVRRLDEVFLSHADLDHYNGLAALLERFHVARVSLTPTFHDRKIAAVRYTLEAIEERGVPVHVLKQGDRLVADATSIEVLHPPARGPKGPENVRSLVLLVRHARHSILLTGDLEGEGLQMLLARPAMPVDVLMAPHHGSMAANTNALAQWARPKLVVSCQDRPTSTTGREEPYRSVGARYLGTWPHGAVTLHLGSDGLIVETFRTGLRWQVRRGGE